MVRRAGFLGAFFFVVACGPKVGGNGDTDSDTDGDTATQGSQSASESADESGGGEGGDVALEVNKDVDILFVIDNSGSMGAVQGLLSANFPAFIDVLEAPDVRANYRIGVTTTDNGNPWCGTTTPEAGKLQLSSCVSRTQEFVFQGNPPSDATAVACTDNCQFSEIATLPTPTEYDPEPRPRPWLERIDGITNLADIDGVVPTAAEAFQCFAPQGIAGCGFESHLESMYKTMLRANNESEAEYGFLRAGAILAIVIVSDEVDCSHNNEHESIFLAQDQGGNQVFWSDPSASAPTSAVCWNAGVVCYGGPGVYDTCEAANKDIDGNEVSDGDADDDAVLHPISRYADFLQAIEDQKQEISPDQEVLVSLIGGVPPGYESGQAELQYADATSPTEQLDFGIGAGCVNNSADPPRTARPPVRERELAEVFQVGEGRNLYSICADDFSPALSDIADAIRDQIRPACMPACVADTNPMTAGLDPECVLIQRAPDGGGAIVDTVLPLCNPDGSVPDADDVCYVPLVDLAGQMATPSPDDDMSEYCTDAGWNLEFRIVRREGVPAPGGAAIEATCQLSQSKANDCPLLP